MKIIIREWEIFIIHKIYLIKLKSRRFVMGRLLNWFRDMKVAKNY